MNRLKDKTILIGREPDNARLLIAIQGSGKGAAIGDTGSVPGSVSRCFASEGKAHVKLTTDQSGNMVLTNMKPENVTFVNGSKVQSVIVHAEDTIEFGKDRYKINLPQILEVALSLAKVASKPTSPQPPAPPVRIFNISHLEKIWDDYHNEVLAIKKRQRDQGILSSLPIFVSMGGSALMALLSNTLGEEYQKELKVLSIVFAVACVILMAYSFFRRKTDTSIEDTEIISNKFQQRYVCPNPDCRKFFGVVSYDMLKNHIRSHRDQKMYCPKCGCELVEIK